MPHELLPAKNLSPPAYWEARARRYAKLERGLPAVCSYGMPAFYNRYIDVLQRRALQPWLQHMRGTRVLDVGCGVGRWSIELARNGAKVTGIDISTTMVKEAARQAQAAGVHHNCLFERADLSNWHSDASFDHILSVTVLQHILDPEKFAATVDTLARALRPKGRLVLLEVAPSHVTQRCDSTIFTSRSLAEWQMALGNAGLRIEHVGGVDPAPFKTQLLPHYRTLAQPLASMAMAAALAVSAPLDFLLAQKLADRSWHKIIIATKAKAGLS